MSFWYLFFLVVSWFFFFVVVILLFIMTRPGSGGAWPQIICPTKVGCIMVWRMSSVCLKRRLKRLSKVHGNNQYICVTQQDAGWCHQKKTNTFSKDEVFAMIDLVVDNSFFRFGDRVYRQCIGIPMGIDPAPQMANEKHSTLKSSIILISLGTYPNDQPMAYTSPKLYVMPKYVTKPRISSTGSDYSSTNCAKNISPKNGCWQPWRNVAGRTPGLWINTTMG